MDLSRVLGIRSGPSGPCERAAGARAAAELCARLQAAPRPVVAMAALYPDTSTSSRHSHRRGQFILGLAGVTAMMTDEGSYIVPPEHGLWIPAGTVHQSRSWADVDVLSLYIDPDTVPDFPSRCRLMRTSPLLRALMDEVVRLPVLYDEDGRDGLLVDLLLAEIGRMPTASLHVPIPEDFRLSGICEAFLADTSSDRTLDDWAALAGVSRRTFTRLFRRETGMSFAAWQQKVRLLEALARLGGGEPVTRVALDVGYDSPSAFAAMFKRALGTSPRQYLSWTDDEVMIR
jgi:AraC-like DNA-binding protein/mannose-6-phosphate isomerase-like protein (cupin superfamily)